MGRRIYIDLGANNGVTIRQFVAENPGFAVIGFEPTPALAEKLRSDFAGAHTNVHIMEYAAWIHDGVTTFFLGIDSDQSSTAVENKTATKRWRVDYANGITVRTMDFDRWFHENFADDDQIVVKMDIEGAEYKVLQRMLLSGSLRLIDELRVEWHWQRYPNEATEAEHARIRTAVAAQCKLVDWI